jgi:hypothetical protein
VLSNRKAVAPVCQKNAALVPARKY